MPLLSDIPTLPPNGTDKGDCKDALPALCQKLYEQQNVFYADGRFSLLVILQGMDTCGKDGTVRHVFRAINPMGLRVKAFKKPTEEEMAHDYLWRIFPHFPERRMIQIFNRSYYEDIIVPKAEGLLPPDRIAYRCELTNTIERHLLLGGTHILKFFIHISPEEQRERIEERKTIPHKKWKYDKADQHVANKWDEYNAANELILNACSSAVPWHIIPGDKKWYRNYRIAQIVTDYLDTLKLEYPK